ncbi:hypothetical protein AgCh_001828 [Apium graveolens]
MSAALLGVMGTRFKKSSKIFPAGVVSLVSFVMTGRYLHGILPDLKEDGSTFWRSDQVIAHKESNMQGNLSVLPGSTWRSLSMGERGPLALPDLRDLPSDGRSRTSDFG